MYIRNRLETDPDFAEEFAQTFNNPDVPEADDSFDPDSYDSYLGMEIALDRDGQEPQFARVSKRLKDNSGAPIGQQITIRFLTPDFTR